MRLVGFGVRVGRGGRAPVAEVLAQGGESPRRAPRLLDRGFDGSFDGVCGGCGRSRRKAPFGAVLRWGPEVGGVASAPMAPGLSAGAAPATR